MIDRALDRHAAILNDPLRIAAALGGRELAAILGAALAARRHNIPVILDGFVCTAAVAPLYKLRTDTLAHALAGARLRRGRAPHAARRTGPEAAHRSQHAARRSLRRGAGGAASCAPRSPATPAWRPSPRPASPTSRPTKRRRRRRRGRNILFSQTPAALDWLKQFEASDQIDAATLLDSMLLVGMDALIDGIRSLVLDRGNRIDGAIGLYVERELKIHKGKPKPLFAEMKVPRSGRLRAVGDGPKPVHAMGRNPEVGSEGILSWLVTEICRQYPHKYVSHPGPDEIRQKRIRGFFVITDFLGSGKRTSTYLDAAWRVRSVKSWRSGKQISFHVIAYSGTKDGILRVQSHRARSTVSYVKASPTIDDAFSKNAGRFKDLCRRYDPVSNHPIWSLGFGGVGALIAFAHGCPNNAPRMLHSSKENYPWTPLFAGRVTAASRGDFPNSERPLSEVQRRLRRLGDEKLADSPWLSRLTDHGRVMLIVLAALRRGPRFDFALSERTGLTISEIDAALAVASELNWIRNDRRLTEAGIDELEQARKRDQQRISLPTQAKPLYVPTSLRMP